MLSEKIIQLINVAQELKNLEKLSRLFPSLDEEEYNECNPFLDPNVVIQFDIYSNAVDAIDVRINALNKTELALSSQVVRELKENKTEENMALFTEYRNIKSKVTAKNGMEYLKKFM